MADMDMDWDMDPEALRSRVEAGSEALRAAIARAQRQLGRLNQVQGALSAGAAVDHAEVRVAVAAAAQAATAANAAFAASSPVPSYSAQPTQPQPQHPPSRSALLKLEASPFSPRGGDYERASSDEGDAETHGGDVGLDLDSEAGSRAGRQSPGRFDQRAADGSLTSQAPGSSALASPSTDMVLAGAPANQDPPPGPVQGQGQGQGHVSFTSSASARAVAHALAAALGAAAAAAAAANAAATNVNACFV
jgi:hypothetical protein